MLWIHYNIIQTTIGILVWNFACMIHHFHFQFAIRLKDDLFWLILEASAVWGWEGDKSTNLTWHIYHFLVKETAHFRIQHVFTLSMFSWYQATKLCYEFTKLWKDYSSNVYDCLVSDLMAIVTQWNWEVHTVWWYSKWYTICITYCRSLHDNKHLRYVQTVHLCLVCIRF